MEFLTKSPCWLDARSRTIRLADLLIEVENDLGFSVHFQQPGEKRVDPGEICALLAAILAHGCNLGLYTMEKVTPDIAYRRLKHVSDWRLVEENQSVRRPAQPPPASQSIFAYTLLREIGNAPDSEGSMTDAMIGGQVPASTGAAGADVRGERRADPVR